MKKLLFLTALLLTGLLAPRVQAAPPAQAPEGEVYTVQAGDWLSRIAEKYYGDILAYPRIVEATNDRAAEDDTFSPIDNPDRIEVGQKLWIPQTTEAAAPPSGGAPPAQTTVIRYVPQIPAETVEGSCWTSSIAAPGSPFAWRCTVGNQIYDPCLTAVDGETIVCGVPDQEVGLVLTEPLPQPETGDSPPRPWQVELAGEVTCAPFTGTLPPIEEQAVYSCSDQSVILGEIQMDDPIWHAQTAQIEPNDAGPLPFQATNQELVPVLRAWLAGDPAQAIP